MSRARATLIRGTLAATALCAIELTLRELTRRSPLHAITGTTLSNAAIAVVSVVCAAAAATLARKVQGRAVTIAVLLAAFSVGVAVQLKMGARLQSDGFYYYAYLRSLAFDHDVDFTNDYRMLGLGDKAHLFRPTRTGHAQSAWTIGPAIVWSPFFAVGHLAATRLHAAGVDVSTDGTSFPYRQAVCIAGLFYGLLGCWFAYRITRHLWPPAIAGPTVALTMTGSFMLWYMVAEPTMTHAPSMAAVAGFVWLWLATRERRTVAAWALLGLAAGLMALIRWQNALFMILPALDVLPVFIPHSDRRARSASLTGAGVFLLCGLVAFLPQMLAWKAIYGSYVARSPIGPAIRWGDPHIIDVLFSARNGLLSTSPMLYLAAAGLVLIAFERPRVGLPALVATAMMVYFNACIQDWWGSAGFGGRRFDGTIPLFCLGLAALVDAGSRVVRRYPLPAVIGALGAVALANVALVQAAHDGTVRIGETVPFDRAWSAQVRIVHAWFGNPFTYPASLAFALRNGASPADYDRLATDRFLGDPLRPYGRVDIGGDDDWLIEDGWHAPERDGAATYRWAAQRATLRLPLDHSASLRVQLRLHAFAYQGAPQQSVTIAANGHACAPLAVPPDWQTVECALDEASWRSGVNRLALVFAYEARPIDVGLGSDPRPLSAAVDWVRVSIISPGTAP
jgi:hypothetical protein